jgi:hypothetical protein
LHPRLSANFAPICVVLMACPACDGILTNIKIRVTCSTARAGNLSNLVRQRAFERPRDGKPTIGAADKVVEKEKAGLTAQQYLDDHA